jgi:hypothetical protein
MSESIEEKYFDFSLKVLNYAIEFVNQTGYSSLRMTDVLENLALLSTQIDGVNKKDFYLKLNNKFKNKPLMSTPQERSIFLNELFDMFIEEWRNKKD